jgi:redox-sensitive bicupin YhaK (pirin superfamily)
MAARSIQRVVRGQAASDGAGVRLNRVIGGSELAELDPFLLLDEFRSESAADYIAGFPDHPHRGFETVTYMLAGRMRHGDNQGNSGLLLPGSVQWMTAGRGIVHSEMPEQEGGLMQGFQLWINLPAKDKMSAPRYQDIAPERIPQVDGAEGSQVRVIAGRYAGETGPVQAGATEPLYLDVRLPATTSLAFPLPQGHNTFIYVYEGAAEIGARAVSQGDLAVLTAGTEVRVAGAAAARFLLVAGKPLNEPVARYGPFVMNTREEIHQAVRDFSDGRL